MKQFGSKKWKGNGDGAVSKMSKPNVKSPAAKAGAEN